LENFGQTFYNSIKKLIDINAQKPYFLNKFNEADRSLFQEVFEHARFSIECVEKFHGRVDLLDQVIYKNQDKTFKITFYIFYS